MSSNGLLLSSFFAAKRLSFLSLTLLLLSLLPSSLASPTCDVWSLYGYSDAQIPQSLWNNVPALVQFDGPQSWYDAGCDALNKHGNDIVSCESCLPR